MAVERDAGLRGRCLRSRQRDPENRVRAEAALVRRAVGLDQRGVEQRPGRRRRYRRRPRAARSFTFATACGDALAAPRGASVAQLDGLVDAGRGARTGRSADPAAPDSSRTSTSTVGFPRESSTCRPCTSAILVIRSPSQGRSSDPARESERRPVLAVCGGEALGLLDPREKRPAAARSSSSGSTFSRRATLTHANSTSPSSAGDPRIGLALGRPAPARKLGAKLEQLLVQVSERSGDVGVVEADRGGPALHLSRQQKRRQASRGRRGRCLRGPPGRPSAAPSSRGHARPSSPRRLRRRAGGARSASR